MGEKVTDLMGSLYFEIGQNFKNRGHLYNKHPKFIYRGFNFTFCPYNINFIPSCNNDEQQAYYNYNYSKNIVPQIELDISLLKNWLYRFCPWIAHTNLLAKYHRATVQEERQVTYTPKFGSEAFHL